MQTRFTAVLLLLALFASPFSVLAQEVPVAPSEEVVETEAYLPTSEEVPAEPLVGEILATSTEPVLEEATIEVTEEVLAPLELIEPDTYVEGEVIVVFEDTADADTLTEVLGVATANVEQSEAGVVLPIDAPIEQVIAELSALPEVAYAEPNYIRSLDALASTSDPLSEDLWGLEKIQASHAWASSTGEEIIVAVLDTGVDYTHEDLVANMWDGSSCVASTSEAIVGGCLHGYDFVDNDAIPFDGNGHGTHVAGTIAAVMGNQRGVAGVAPNVRIMALRIMDDGGNGNVSDEVAAIQFAIANGARIINASYSGSGESETERAAIEAFENAGGLFIAAAGNQGKDTDQEPAYPASHDVDALISVAATDHSDALASFSNYGNESVDVGAPGTSILSTYPDDEYAFATGTSMATPHVAGIAALLKAFRPNLGTADVKEIILSSGDAVPSLAGKTVSGKRVNAYEALRTAELQTADTAAPVITLIGNNPLSLTFGQNYIEHGATAMDETDGDLTTHITISGDVNSNVAGSYPVTYRVSDAAGNEAVVVRDVIIEEEVRSRPRGGGGGGGSKKKTDDPARSIQSGMVLGATTPHLFTFTLAEGASGDEVRELQKALKNFGYFKGSETGMFGPETKAAVIALQTTRGLPVTGVLDEGTRTMLNQLSTLLAYLFSELARLLALRTA